MNAKKAFTLIEMLIAVAIIALLAVTLVPKLLSSPSKARDAARKKLLADVANLFSTMVIDGTGLPENQNYKVAGNCLTYAGYTAYNVIRQKGLDPVLPKITGDANNIQKNGLCADTLNSYIYYKKFSATSFMLAVEVQNPEAANVEKNVKGYSWDQADSPTPGSIGSVTTLDAALALTDEASKKGVGNGLSPEHYFYILTK